MSTLLLTEQDFIEASEMIDCEVATIKAVQSVESSGKGFNDDGSLVIRFEAHKFHKFTGGAYDAAYPQISHVYDPKIKTDTGYKAFYLAISLNRQAALLSTSYGLFQICGFNHIKAGFSDVESYYKSVCESERNQLFAFVNFCKNCNLTLNLRNKNWKGFAAAYNGKNYSDFNYDKRLADAYAKFKPS